nr:unnamed protein product [Callosobruchus analis]
MSLDDHVVRKHPDFISSPKACSHCDASFRDKRALDDHILKKHPNFTSSITSEIHRCPECPVIVNVKTFKREHKSIRSRCAHYFKHDPCVHCNATFKSKLSLEEHVIRKHPDLSGL